jgi:hypothetical protein
MVLLAQVGFLYLRYVCDPRKLWEWLRDYVDDKEVGALAHSSQQLWRQGGSFCAFSSWCFGSLEM